MSTTKQWKRTAINKAGGISDGFSVFIAIGGHVAIWILFGCLVANIIQIMVSLPQSVTDGVMLAQIITLDIAGFGLRTIAKALLKSSNEEIKASARGAKRLATFLIGLMMLTLVLITSKWLVPSVASYVDLADKVLILARVVLTVWYMHTMHDLRETEAEIQEQEDKQQEANDKKVLEIDQRVHIVESGVHTLVDTVHTLSLQMADVYTEQQKFVDKMCTEQAVIAERVHKTAEMYTNFVDTKSHSVDINQHEDFKKLAEFVYSLSVSVDEMKQSMADVHSTVTEYTESTRRVSTRTQRSLQAKQTAVIEADQDTQALVSSGGQALSVPDLEVPGISQVKVIEVLTAYLSGTTWRDISGNYSRTIKPIRDVYEQYLLEEEDVYTQTV